MILISMIIFQDRKFLFKEVYWVEIYSDLQKVINDSLTRQKGKKTTHFVKWFDIWPTLVLDLVSFQ